MSFSLAAWLLAATQGQAPAPRIVPVLPPVSSLPASIAQRASDIGECTEALRHRLPAGTDVAAFCTCMVDRMIQARANERPAMEYCATRMGFIPGDAPPTNTPRVSETQLPVVTYIVPGRRGGVVFLPESAVLSDGRRNYVLVLDDGDRTLRRDVAIRPAGRRGIAIIRGLEGDERVVDRAGPFLNPGQRVRPEPTE